MKRDRQERWRLRLRKRAVKALLGARKKACQHCGKKGRLEFAHTKPTGLNGPGRGQARRWLDVIRHPSHYILLCRGCHVKYDAGGQ